MLAKSTAFVFSLALPLLLVRRLNQREFGLYKQAFLLIGTAVAVLPLSVGMSAFYFLPREEDINRRRNAVFNIVLFNAFVGGLVFLLFATQPWIFSKLFHDPELAQFGPLIGAVILFWLFSTFLEVVTVVNREAQLATFFIVGGQVSKALWLLVAAVFFGSIRSLLIAALIHSAMLSLLLLGYLNLRFKNFWRSFDWGMLREQLAYALPYGASAMLFTAQTDLHNYFVSNHFGAATFAIYSIGCLQLPLVGILSESIASVTIPRISYLQKLGDKREILLLMTRLMRKLAVIYFPLYAILLVGGHEFIRWLFTEKYSASFPIFAINITLLPFYVIMLDPIVRAYAEQRYFLLRLRFVLFCILLLSLWFSINHYGILGVITVVVSITLSEHLIVTYRSAKILGVKRADMLLLRDVAKLALAAIVAGIVAAIARSLFLSLKPFYLLSLTGMVLLVTYLAMSLMLGVPTAEERSMVRKKLTQCQRLLRLNRATESF
ncbi:MAG: lipopolysaccharide biosynthesis protein [Pyrinomonadaceae bacterium]